MRLAPSPGAQDSDGILRRRRRPRVDKREHEHRLRGSRSTPSEEMRMRFMGIDVAAERHVVAVVDETNRVLLKATPFTEDAEGRPSCSGCWGCPPTPWSGWRRLTITVGCPIGRWKNCASLVRFRDRLRQDFGDRVRQLHRLVDLGFPELTRHVRDLGSELATRLLREYPHCGG